MSNSHGFDKQHVKIKWNLINCFLSEKNVNFPTLVRVIRASEYMFGNLKIKGDSCCQMMTLVAAAKENRQLSPYLTGLRLFCDSWRQTSRVGRKAVSKQSPVILYFLACVAK